MLNSRGSVHCAAGAAARAGDLGRAGRWSGSTSMPFLLSARASCRWSTRNRLWQQRHSMSGSVNVADVARGHPGLAGQDDRGVQPDDVVAAGHHGLPPLALDVLLELHAERAVVPRGPRPAVDLAAREDEAPALGEADDGVDGGGGCGHAAQGIGPARACPAPSPPDGIRPRRAGHRRLLPERLGSRGSDTPAPVRRERPSSLPLAAPRPRDAVSPAAAVPPCAVRRAAPCVVVVGCPRPVAVVRPGRRDPHPRMGLGLLAASCPGCSSSPGRGSLGPERLMRCAVVVMAVAMTVTQALPRPDRLRPPGPARRPEFDIFSCS